MVSDLDVMAMARSFAVLGAGLRQEIHGRGIVCQMKSLQAPLAGKEELWLNNRAYMAPPRKSPALAKQATLAAEVRLKNKKESKRVAGNIACELRHEDNKRQPRGWRTRRRRRMNRDDQGLSCHVMDRSTSTAAAADLLAMTAKAHMSPGWRIRVLAGGAHTTLALADSW